MKGSFPVNKTTRFFITRTVFLGLLCLALLTGVCSAEEAAARETAYWYCEYELGYTRDELTPYNYVQNDDNSWDFSFSIKNPDPQTNGLVLVSLNEDGSLRSIQGPSPVSAFEWLNWDVRRCLFSYEDIYRLKQEWEPKLDSLPESEMELFNLLHDRNPILDFLKHDIVLPDDRCISYEDARKKSVEIIESMDGWTGEMTKHIDIIAEVVHIPSGMDHPVYQFIYTLASDAASARNNFFDEEYTDAFGKMLDRMWKEEEEVFQGNYPMVISLRIDAWSGEQVGEIYLETPPVSKYGYTAIILWT